MDDAIFVSWMLQVHHDHLQKVSKCPMFQKEVPSPILYHWESKHEQKLKAVWEWPSLNDKHTGGLLGLLSTTERFDSRSSQSH
jgi:DNA mismatch repair protein MutH